MAVGVLALRGVEFQMAFTDLDEHLAEAFGDSGRVDGWQPDLWIRPTRHKHRTPQQRARDTRQGIQWRSARRRTTAAWNLAAGLRPTRCQRPGCCNLLSPTGNGGRPRRFCRPTCRDAKRDRDARRSPEGLRRKRERWNEIRRGRATTPQQRQ